MGVNTRVFRDSSGVDIIAHGVVVFMARGTSVFVCITRLLLSGDMVLMALCDVGKERDVAHAAALHVRGQPRGAWAT